MPGKETERSKTVGHALSLLTLFVRRGEWRVSELAAELGISGGAVHRLVRTLVDGGFLEQRVERGPFVLGPTLSAIAHHAARRRTLSSLAHRRLHSLAELTGEAIDLCVLRDQRYVCVDSVDLSNRTQSAVQVGDSAALHAGAAGKVILAFQSETFIAHYLDTPLLRLTEHTIAERRSLLDELTRIRERGYAVSESEVTPGTSSLAVPIRDSSAQVVASLNVFAAAGELRGARREALLRALTPVADELSSGLGHTWGVEA